MMNDSIFDNKIDLIHFINSATIQLWAKFDCWVVPVSSVVMYCFVLGLLPTSIYCICYLLSVLYIMRNTNNQIHSTFFLQGFFEREAFGLLQTD